MLNKLTMFTASLGRRALSTCESFGRATLMLFGAIFTRPRPIKNFPLLTKQLYSVGVQSLAIIVVSGLFIGMVLSLQGYIVLVDYSAEGNLGQMVALSLLRELGPVVTALLFAGRAGSAGNILSLAAQGPGRAGADRYSLSERCRAATGKPPDRELM